MLGWAKLSGSRNKSDCIFALVVAVAVAVARFLVMAC